MARFFLTFLGLAVAHLPRWILQPLSWAVGSLFFMLARRRRRILLGNLSHAFPDWSHGKLCRFARRNSARLIELGLFSLASPFLSQARLRRYFSLSPACRAGLENAGPPRLLLIPHGTLTEAMVFLPHLLGDAKNPMEFGVLYRPFANDAVEDYIKRSRGRFGVRLLSRKTGLFAAIKLLQHGRCVGLLFDQNAGRAGTLSLLADRIASTTTLPDLLRRRIDNVDVLMAYPQRTGFWRATILLERLELRRDGLIHSMNGWLADKLRLDAAFRADWLWCHNRWKLPPEDLLHLENRKSALAEALKFHSLSEPPRNFRVLCALPGSFQDFDRLAAAFQTIRKARPDARITVLGNHRQIGRLANWQTIDRRQVFRRSPFTAIGQLYHLRHEFFDLQILTAGDRRLQSAIINIPTKVNISNL